MKPCLPVICLSLLFCASHAVARQAVADDRQASERCLHEVKTRYQHNPEVTALLKGAQVKDFTLERYDEKVGSQPVASEIVATLARGDRAVGQILCLTHDETILYTHFFSANAQQGVR